MMRPTIAKVNKKEIERMKINALSTPAAKLEAPENVVSIVWEIICNNNQ